MVVMDGIIKNQLEHTVAPPLPAESLHEINTWRQLVYGLKLVGQDPARYGGYGYGNVSMRIPPYDAPVNHRAFVITGTQTGEVGVLTPLNYTVVTAYSPERNLLVSEGPCKPSSESLTHGSVYDQDPAIRWVIHAHSPEIWRNAAALTCPPPRRMSSTARRRWPAKWRLFAETDVRSRGIFVMGGHDDGVVAFGATAEAAAEILIGTLLIATKLKGA
ncbi:MAG: class II aldolase/adducin family protein [Caldilineaceae bacterium]|nr:class II aldolase/adducin family protein [Caldilineaceae bacterium]